MLDIKKLLTKILQFNRCFYSITSSAFPSPVDSGTEYYQDVFTATKDCTVIGHIYTTFPSSTTGRRATRIYTLTNGTRTLENMSSSAVPVNGSGTAITLPITLKMTAGETFGIRLNQNSGISMTVTSYFSGLIIV